MRELAIKLLKEKNLRITSQRLSILYVLLNDQTKAYSSTDLLRFLKQDMNASTVYRSLDKLVEIKLISKKVDINGDSIYILNLEKRCKHVPHPHLKCHGCGVLECLPAFPIDYANQLYNSGVEGLDIVLSGLCAKCTKI